MDQIILPPSIDDVPPPGMGLVEELDKLLMVQLRDGRKVIGVMRSFDQFANIVLEGEPRIPFMVARRNSYRETRCLITDLVF